MADSRFILASRSPRRIELLRDAGFDFAIAPADIDESDVPPGLSPRATAEYLARAKAAVVARARPGEIVVGADTIVAVGDTLFGKADTPAEARTMLTAQGNTRQTVITGIAVVSPPRGELLVESATSIVFMRTLTHLELDAYIQSEAWRGKAGAYGIQDVDPANDPFVKLLEGTFDNVVGLPVGQLTKLLARVGILPTLNSPLTTPH